jgi:hypothetical protein
MQGNPIGGILDTVQLQILTQVTDDRGARRPCLLNRLVERRSSIRQGKHLESVPTRDEREFRRGNRDRFGDVERDAGFLAMLPDDLQDPWAEILRLLSSDPVY